MNADLVALYELKRQGFLLGFMQFPERINSALAFAYDRRLCPIFHEGIARETYKFDPYEEVYAVKREFMEQVLRYVDEKWREKDAEALGFYKLEDKFGGYKTYRLELIHTLEYFRISRRFDADLWSAIESDAPSEANSLDASFSPEDVDLS